MHCALGHWFSGVRLALLCGTGNGSRDGIGRPGTANSGSQVILESNGEINGRGPDTNGNESVSESFEEEDLQRLLELVAHQNGFQRPKYKVTVATKAGDNYVGRVLRAVIREDGSHRKESLSLIFKTAPASKARREAFHSGIIFYNEGNMYETVLPAFNAFLKEYGLSDSVAYPGTARCLATKLSADTSTNAEDVLVLEDMAPKGYVMLDRTVGLDADVCRLILRELARLHAVSMAMRQLRPDDTAKLESGVQEILFVPGNSLINDMLPMVEKSVSYIEDRYPPNTPVYKKVKNFVNNFGEVMCELATPKEELSCLLHGDCWTNNVLFKLNKDGRVEKACLIDFQLSRISSPVLDIAYLLFTGTTKKTRDAHYQQLIQDYYDALTSNLTSLGCDSEALVPWSLLQDHLKSYSRFGLGMVLFTMPLFLANSSDIPDMNEMNDEENANFSDMYSNINNSNLQELKTRISDIVQDFIELGYL